MVHKEGKLIGNLLHTGIIGVGRFHQLGGWGWGGGGVGGGVGVGGGGGVEELLIIVYV